MDAESLKDIVELYFGLLCIVVRLSLNEGAVEVSNVNKSDLGSGISSFLSVCRLLLIKMTIKLGGGGAEMNLNSVLRGAEGR